MTGQEAQKGTQEVPLEQEEKLWCEGTEALEQTAQGDCGVSFFEENPNTPGHSDPKQTAVGKLTLAGGIRLDDLQMSLLATTM